MLSREQILAADDRRRDLVEVPEWGGSVYVTVMSGTARDDWEAWLVGQRKDGTISNARAHLVVATVVDETGARLFSLEDVVALGQKSSTALDRLVAVARRLNKLGDQAIEDAEKN